MRRPGVPTYVKATEQINKIGNKLNEFGANLFFKNALISQ